MAGSWLTRLILLDAAVGAALVLPALVPAELLTEWAEVCDLHSATIQGQLRCWYARDLVKILQEGSYDLEMKLVWQ